MSVWKKASKVNQKIHHERSQLRERSHLGFLEKKKDYKARANNANHKKAVLKALKKRALNRNPDEFYFHMVNSKVIDGEHHEKRKQVKHTPEQIALMQTRDLKYIGMRRTIEKRKIEKMKAQLHFVDKANEVKNKHIFFVDTEEEAIGFDVAQRLDTHPALLDRRSNRLRVADLQSISLPDMDEMERRRLAARTNKTYGELAKRLRRERELGVVQRKLEVKRSLVSTPKDSKPQRIKGPTPKAAPVYQWPRERKR